MRLSKIQMGKIPRAQNDKYIEREFYRGYHIIECLLFSSESAVYAHAYTFIAVKYGECRVSIVAPSIFDIKKNIDSKALK